MKPELNQEITLTIDALGNNGEGIGRLDNFTLFVNGCLPGETVKARVAQVKKNYGKADLISVLKSSPNRREPPCPIFNVCGGCQLQHLSYSEQLLFKENKVRNALERIGGFKEVSISSCLPSPKLFHYRNKIQLKSDGSKLGFYKNQSHEIVDVDQCLIHCDLGERVYSTLRALLAPHLSKISEVIIKSAVHSQQVLVDIKGDLSILDQIAAQLCSIHPEVRISESIYESLLGLSFPISKSSFFQVNPFQVGNLYKMAISAINIQEYETVVDAYCGVGVLSMLSAPKAKKVIGIEGGREAIKQAKLTAKSQNISNVEFVCSSVEKHLLNIQASYEVIILNPPRMGCDHSVLEAIAEHNPSRVLYISCDPATLARDLQYLSSSGYTLKSVQPVDMFPQTVHVETISLLVK